MDCAVGDTVVYGRNGVCQIEDIREERMGRGRPEKYYILKTLFVKQAVTVFVPLNNEKLLKKIQPVMSRKDAEALLDAAGNVDIDWPEDRNARKDYFYDIMATGDRKDIIGLIRTVTEHKEQLASEGKNLNMQDEKVLAEALHRMNSEFAVAFDMGIDEVPGFIRERLTH